MQRLGGWRERAVGIVQDERRRESERRSPALQRPDKNARRRAIVAWVDRQDYKGTGALRERLQDLCKRIGAVNDEERAAGLEKGKAGADPCL